MAASNAYLFAPAPAVRMQWDTYTDTPLNPDVAAAENPPDGAIIDYYLKSPPAGDLKLEIYDSAGKLVRSYSSSGAAIAGLQGERARLTGWRRPPCCRRTPGCIASFGTCAIPIPEQLLYTYYGVHVNYFEYTLADHAIPHNTPWHEPQGPMVVPGQYEVRLTVGGQTLRQPITVKLDPRLKVSTAGVAAAVGPGAEDRREHECDVRRLQSGGAIADRTGDRFDKLQKAAIAEALAARGAGREGAGVDGCSRTAGRAGSDESRPHAADDRGGSVRLGAGQRVVDAFKGMCQETKAALARWDDLRTKDVVQLNAMLAQVGLAKLTAPRAIGELDCGK